MALNVFVRRPVDSRWDYPASCPAQFYLLLYSGSKSGCELDSRLRVEVKVVERQAAQALMEVLEL